MGTVTEKAYQMNKEIILESKLQELQTELAAAKKLLKKEREIAMKLRFQLKCAYLEFARIEKQLEELTESNK